MKTKIMISLKLEEDNTLKELEIANDIPPKIRRRAMAIRLNAKGWTIKGIADYLGWADSTVRQTIRNWEISGLAGLWEMKGRGKKAKWTREDLQAIEKWLEEDQGYNARELSQKLSRERNVVLGTEQVRRILKQIVQKK